MDNYQLLAFIGGGLVIISTLPQVIKTLKTKKVEDLSLSMFVLLFSAQVIWILYGFHINDLPVIFTNVFSMIIIVTNIFLILKYKNYKKSY